MGFDAFMLPLTTAFESLGAVLAAGGYNSEEVRKTVIGLARDLRGVAFAFNTKTSYMMLFDWIYPTYTPIMQRAVEIWYQDPQVTTPILKLFAELVQNRSQRLQFDVSSPNGILLFREASNIICSYGNRILDVQVAKDQMYPLKLKGISICFSMLKAALCGSYVNFGVFRLYGGSSGTRHDGVHGLLRHPRPHCHLPVQESHQQSWKESAGIPDFGRK